MENKTEISLYKLVFTQILQRRTESCGQITKTFKQPKKEFPLKRSILTTDTVVGSFFTVSYQASVSDRTQTTEVKSSDSNALNLVGKKIRHQYCSVA